MIWNFFLFKNKPYFCIAPYIQKILILAPYIQSVLLILKKKYKNYTEKKNENNP